MTNIQRMKSNIATQDRRDLADKARNDNRVKNDELTIERRDKADKVLDENRLKNDEMTANRRERNDGYPTRTIVSILLVLAILAAWIYFF
ncbi:MAG: hypothetical protein AABW82_02780 [Nanoarchaeota archaeon]